MTAVLEPTASLTEQSAKLLLRACDAFPDPVFVKDLSHRWVSANRAFFALLQLPPSAVLGKSDPDFFPKDQADVFWKHDDELFASQQPSEKEEKLTDASGTVRTIWTRKYPLYGDDGALIGLCGIITDITKVRATIEQDFRLAAEVEEQQRVITAQSRLLDELAVPVIRIWEGILLLPLIGEITAQRAMQFEDSLLRAISEHQAEFALIDITGVPLVDSTVAGYLLRSNLSARLLGCQTIMVGIGAGVATQIVRLGADFSVILTRSTLQQGLEFAMQHARSARTLASPLRKTR